MKETDFHTVNQILFPLRGISGTHAITSNQWCVGKTIKQVVIYKFFLAIRRKLETKEPNIMFYILPVFVADLTCTL